jgi:hypothetical protein
MDFMRKGIKAGRPIRKQEKNYVTLNLKEELHR